MGCSTSQSSQKNNNAPQRSESKRRGSSTAFREELDDDYLKSIESRLPPDTKVLILKLFSLSHMPYEHDKSGTYIEMETKPSDTVADNQYQRSTSKIGNTSYCWIPPEKFQFVITDATKIRFSVFHSHLLRRPEAVGNGFLNVENLSTGKNQKVNVHLLNSLGKREGDIDIEVSVCSVEETKSFREHIMYEFQRWEPTHGWGHEHLMLTDPGRWSDEHAGRFSHSRTDVEPPIPQGWVVREQWYTFGNSMDPDGWEYSTGFDGSVWAPVRSTSTLVRRRVWLREIAKDVSRDCTQPATEYMHKGSNAQETVCRVEVSAPPVGTATAPVSSSAKLIASTPTAIPAQAPAPISVTTPAQASTTTPAQPSPSDNTPLDSLSANAV